MDNIGNYRPVTNVSFLSKVVERVVADQLQALLDETNALDPFQSGFRLCHGTETALVTMFDDLLREGDRGKMSLLVLLNISATSDTVDHGILLGKLSELGIDGLALAWLHSFLEDCPQRVQLGENFSALWSLNCGVLQGSIISPMMFNIYMRLLRGVIGDVGLRVISTLMILSSTSPFFQQQWMLSHCLNAAWGLFSNGCR